MLHVSTLFKSLYDLYNMMWEELFRRISFPFISFAFPNSSKFVYLYAFVCYMVGNLQKKLSSYLTCKFLNLLLWILPYTLYYHIDGDHTEKTVLSNQQKYFVSI